VHEGKESGGRFARGATLYGPIPRPTRGGPQRLEQPLVRKAAAAEFVRAMPSLASRIPPV
jgi:hypothetical protein